MKYSIYCCYTPIDTHQWPHYLPIFHFSPLLPTITSFYLFISPLFSTLMSLFIYLFIFFLFWLFLSPFYYYKYDNLSPILYTFFHMKKVITLSLSLMSYVFVNFFIFCISTLDWCIYVFFRILLWVAIWFFVFKLLSFFFSFLWLLNVILLQTNIVY